MKQKITVAAFVIAIFTVACAFATVQASYETFEGEFTAEGYVVTTTTPVSNVNIIGFVCADAACDTVSDVLWEGQTLSTGDSNRITLTYPTTLQSEYGYAVFYFKDGYISWVQVPNWAGNDIISEPEPKYVLKAESCIAPISDFTVTNSVTQGQKIMVNVKANLDDITQSPFDYSSIVGYRPAQLESISKVSVKNSLTITDTDGNVVNSQEQIQEISPSDDAQYEFEYTPLVPGKYFAKVESQVPDSKCMSSQEDVESKTFNVVPFGPIIPNRAPIQTAPLSNYTFTYNDIARYDINSLPDYFSDPDGDELAYSLVSNSRPDVINCIKTPGDAINCGTIRDVTGCTIITVAASDGHLSTQGNFQVCTRSTNHAPTFRQLPNAALPNPNTGGGTSHILNLDDYVTDIDGDSLAYSISFQSASALVNCQISGTHIVCESDLSDSGYSDVRVVANDGFDTSSSIFRITVTKKVVNTGLTLSGIGDVLLKQGSGLVQNVTNLATYTQNPQSRALTYSVVSQSNTAVVSCSIAFSSKVNCQVLGTSGQYSDITVKVSDGIVESSDTFRVSIVANVVGNSCIGPGGVTIAHDSRKLYYAEPSVPYGEICVDEYRVCNNGYLSGSFTYVSCAPEAAPANTNCTSERGQFVEHATSRLFFLTATVPFGSQCVNQSRSCTNGTLSGTYQFATCSVLPQNPLLSCNAPDGSVLQSGNSKLFYQTATVPFGSQCVNQTRVCTNGVLSGSFTFGSCTPAAASTCVGPDNTVLASGSSKFYYQTATVPFGSQCVNQSRVCSNGVLSGSFAFASCTPAAASTCVGPDSSVITSGNFKTYFQTATVPFGQSCVPENRICNNGVLSGTFNFPTCTPASATSCVGPDSSVISSGTFKTYFQTATVPFGQNCVAEPRACNNGILTGSFSFASCTPATAAPCVGPDSSAISSGTFKTYYLTATVPFGQSCTQENRVCNNGLLSGSYNFASCTPATAAPCVGPDGSTIASGSFGTYYQTSTVPFGQTCNSESRTCSNGALSGSFTFASCTPAAGLSCNGPDGAVILSSASRNYYLAASAFSPNSCVMEARTCTNGALSGSYSFANCNVISLPQSIGLDLPEAPFKLNRNQELTTLISDLSIYVINGSGLPLMFSIESQTLNAATCQINGVSLQCTSKHGLDGNDDVIVKVSVGPLSAQDTAKIVVGSPYNTEPAKKIVKEVIIQQFLVPDVVDSSEDVIPITVSVLNKMGKSMKETRVSATILETGAHASADTFALSNGKSASVKIYVPLDMRLPSGTYTVRLTISDKDGLQRIEHRDLLVYN